MKNIRANLIVTGRVQGVCFRMETRRAAKRVGNLSGWVKNLPDGTVAAVLEGNESDVNKMIEWCHKGPAGASVTDVKVEWASYSGNFDSFDINY
ncbi:MAG: acylphosphatase [Desulfobacterales bacterium]|jgi:acylphosphatase|nr:acylphosphatase [Desulfobacterales bacterium]